MASCKTMKVQIIRGVVGVALIIGAALVYKTSFALSVLLLALSLVPLNGCPACWILDTCEIADKSRKAKPVDITPPPTDAPKPPPV